MKILSIETSCDETAISIIEATGGIKKPVFKIVANNVASQIALHTQYGGVFPAMAKREHIKNLPIVLEKVLKEAKINHTPSAEYGHSPLARGRNKIDLIAVTVGPGLEPALWTGIVFAKELAEKYKLPIVPVNHMEGHVLSVLMQEHPSGLKATSPSQGRKNAKYKTPKISFPALALLISGGHTEIVLVKDWMKYKILGATRDDAVGEAFDKVARMLELPYPGGPEISKLAEKMRISHPSVSAGTPSHLPLAGQEKFRLPRPMLHSKDFDFSFSGLKTAVLYMIRDLKKENGDILKNEKVKQSIALEFENAVTEVLVAKTLSAMEKYKIKTLIVGGGVSANKHIKSEIQKAVKKLDSNPLLYFPEKDLSTDNAIMIAIAGYFRFLKNKKGVRINSNALKAVGNLTL